MTSSTSAGLVVRAPQVEGADAVLSANAQALLVDLAREFEPRRRELLARRLQRRRELAAGATLDFLPSTAAVRAADWRVPAAPPDLRKRWVEITGPVERKMMINALNSGADAFMADFEDANAPTWSNLIAGHTNLIDAIERKISFESPDGKQYRLCDKPATIIVRPRGWHLPEKHVLVDGEPMSGSLFDMGLFLFHCARRQLERGSGPYVYLPKLESYLEARLWNDVFEFVQDRIGVPRGSVRATVLVETILAAFEMDEILHALGPHAAGLNAGRWDYMFSIIKNLPAAPPLPDRAQVTMTVPFMRAYTELLVKTCHRRGAHAIGGMAAFIPSRRDAELNARALEKVREDKMRESGDGFDGTWVAHPDLVPTAAEEFRRVLGDRPNQLDRLRDDVSVSAAQLTDTRVPGGTITDAGVRANVSVGLQYVESWLRGVGAAGINNLMEDVATAEISRSQLWQWVHRGVVTTEGNAVSAAFVRRIADEELAALAPAYGAGFAQMRFDDARQIFERVALADDFVDFLTLPAYDLID